MKIAIVVLGIACVLMLGITILSKVPGLALVSNEAPQGYEIGFVDGCIGGIAMTYPEGQRPVYAESWEDCHKLFDAIKDRDRPLAKPPRIQKSHLEELEEQGIEVFRTVWRVP